MKVTIDTAAVTRPFARVGKFLGTKAVALRDKMHDIRVNHDAKQLLRNTEYQMEVNMRALELQGNADLFAPLKKTPARGTSRNKPAAQAKRTPR